MASLLASCLTAIDSSDDDKCGEVVLLLNPGRLRLLLNLIMMKIANGKHGFVIVCIGSPRKMYLSE